MRAYEEPAISESMGLQDFLDQLLEVQRGLLPLATYRLQFHKDFRFADAKALVDYLHDLGISHVYSSPLLRARSDSLHGYDIADHNSLNPQIGGEAAFQEFAAALRNRGLGLILDTVPNHMGVGKGDNLWWYDVLRNGQSSEFADFFDIDWEPLKPELKNKILLPVLGDQYGEELEAGRISLHLENDDFCIRYFENLFPVDPQSIPLIFAGPRDAAHTSPEFSALLTQFQALPQHYDSATEQVRRRRTQVPILLERLSHVLASSPELTAAVHARIEQINGIKGVSESFDALHDLMEAQVYRLANWRVSGEEINYRRFFDVNDLVGLRVENPTVFAETHKLLRKLMADKSISGIRIDHLDGLLNPRQYLIRIQMLFLASQFWGTDPREPVSDNGVELDVQQFMGTQDRSVAPFYCLVEKILEPGESLPEEWPVNGTSGYDFIQQVNGIFIQQKNGAAFTRIYERFIDEPMDFELMLYHCKKVVMHTSLASEVNVLAHLLDEISISDRYARDYTRKALRDVIRETIACFPVYRSYIDERGGIAERDRSYIHTAIRAAKRMNTGTAAAAFDFLASILLSTKSSRCPDELYRRKSHFILKFQQLTGPVMAKGLEDTAAYVYNRFISLNEVGCYPGEFGSSLVQFHLANSQRLETWPNAMLASSTHDTKRSEDVRARLNVLSEIPREWSAKLQSWQRLNHGKKVTLADGRVVPDANEEYLLYQTLIGAWPLAMRTSEQRADFTRRVQAYMDKAIHEAKVNVSWINQDPEYTAAFSRFIAQILEPSQPGRTNFFLKRVEDFLPTMQFFGMINSLAQLLLKLTSPGVPDVYQGTELFDFSLVDPDNRRPVDFLERRHLLNDLLSRNETKLPELCAELLGDYKDGRIKMWTVIQTLRFRRENPQLFREGGYVSLSSQGDKAEHLCAFQRALPSQHGRQAITVVPRFAYTLMKGAAQPPLGDVWGNTEVVLPAGSNHTFSNVLTGEKINSSQAGSLYCRQVFASFPVALLVSE